MGDHHERREPEPRRLLGGRARAVEHIANQFKCFFQARPDDAREQRARYLPGGRRIVFAEQRHFDHLPVAGRAADGVGEEAREAIETLEGLAVQPLQGGLVVPSVHLTGAAVHEDPDDRLRLSKKVRGFRA